MTQRIEIHIVGFIPEGDAFIGHEAVVAARNAIDAVVEAMEAKGITDIKPDCRLVNMNRKPRVAAAKEAFRSVPRGPSAA